MLKSWGTCKENYIRHTIDLKDVLNQENYVVWLKYWLKWQFSEKETGFLVNESKLNIYFSRKQDAVYFCCAFPNPKRER